MTRFLIIILLVACPLWSADVVKTICASGCDYATVAAWEADLDNDTPYDAGDNAIGQLEGKLTQSGVITINGGGTLGLNSVTLTATVSERHNGTAGTGAELENSADGDINLHAPSGFNLKYTISWIEMDKNATGHQGVDTGGSNLGDVPRVLHCLIHDASGGDAFEGAIRATSRDVRAIGNVIYDWRRDTSLTTYGIRADGDQASGAVIGNTVHGVKNTASGVATGITIVSNDSLATAKNNISMANEADFTFAGTNPASDYNMSSDATADDGGGSNHQLSKTTSTQFVSTTNGSEDFHLVTGSNAKNTGVDLTTSKTPAEIDIDGRDRDAQADVWDIGADEFVEVGGGRRRSTVSVTGDGE